MGGGGASRGKTVAIGVIACPVCMDAAFEPALRPSSNQPAMPSAITEILPLVIGLPSSVLLYRLNRPSPLNGPYGASYALGRWPGQDSMWSVVSLLSAPKGRT